MTVGLLKFIRQRFATRRDTEHEQALIRLAVGAVLSIWVFFTVFERDLGFWLCFAFFQISTLGILAGIILRPQLAPARRIFGCVVDSMTVSYFMIHSGVAGMPLFLVYLWITFGNGLRYGNGYLLSSLGISLLGFSTVLAVSDFWHEHLAVGASMFLGMLVLSLYVKTLINRLSVALVRAEAAHVAKRQFVSSISDEMRTPLNAIIGMSQLMRDTKLGQEQSEILDTVDASSHTMLELVNDVLDFSRIEAGKLALNEENFDLYSLIDSTAQDFREQAEGKGLRFHVSIMPDVPPYVHGDRSRLSQVLSHLLANAVKFTPQGEITLHVAKLVEKNGNFKLKVSVRDTGIGITPDLQKCIFESFTQADQSVTRRFGGTGLGATIAKQLVELMGGRIGVESAVGLGSTFWFELSLRQSEHDENEDRSALAEHRILLIGFDKTLSRELTSLIESWGGSTAQAGLYEAAAIANAQNRQGQPFTCALIHAASAAEADAAHARILRGLGHHSLPLILCTAAVNEFPEGRAAGVFAAILRLPIKKNLFFNALHGLVVHPNTSGVLFIADYRKRKDLVQSLKILIADDNATNRLVLARVLERGSHNVVPVESGDAALELLERDSFDLVILDRNMPGIGGIEALRALRVLELGSVRTPVIILSADGSPEVQEEAMSAGADRYMTKPVQSATLLGVISELVSIGDHIGTAPQEAQEAHAIAAALNYETLAHLKALGSTDDFLDKLVHMFLEDNTALLNEMRQAAEAKHFDEVRSLAHALKGSAGSVGLDRLTQLCHDLQRAQESDLRMRSAAYVDSIRREFELARAALLSYLRAPDSKAGSKPEGL